jgi:hypothetical protein
MTNAMSARQDAAAKITEEESHAKAQRRKDTEKEKEFELGIRLGFKPVDVQQNGWNQFTCF